MYFYTYITQLAPKSKHLSIFKGGGLTSNPPTTLRTPLFVHHGKGGRVIKRFKFSTLN